MLRKPLLPSHYSVWVDPPDEDGDEALHVVSERRSIKLKGHSFREFRDELLPLLDGHHTVAEIQEATSDLFRPEDVVECIVLLAEHGVLVEGSERELADGDDQARLVPQLNLFHDLAPGQYVQERLQAATVAVVGLGGAGAQTALGLAAAGVGTVRCVDDAVVAPADVYFSPFIGWGRLGDGRAETVARMVRGAAPAVTVEVADGALASEDDLRTVLEGADVVVCCLDASQSNLVFKLNRVCLAGRIRWVSTSLAGAEVVVGPGVDPGRTACYLCYRMRAVACAGNPEDAFAYERYLDGRKRDESGQRENLVFGAGLAANLLGVEVVKLLTDVAEPSLLGRLLTIRLTDMTIQRHTVLRKPWCPACFAPADGNPAR